MELLRIASVFHHDHGTEVPTDGAECGGLGLLLGLSALFRRCPCSRVSAVSSARAGIALSWPRRRPAEAPSRLLRHPPQTMDDAAELDGFANDQWRHR